MNSIDFLKRRSAEVVLASGMALTLATVALAKYVYGKEFHLPLSGAKSAEVASLDIRPQSELVVKGQRVVFDVTLENYQRSMGSVSFSVVEDGRVTDLTAQPTLSEEVVASPSYSDTKTGQSRTLGRSLSYRRSTKTTADSTSSAVAESPLQVTGDDVTTGYTAGERVVEFVLLDGEPAHLTVSALVKATSSLCLETEFSLIDGSDRLKADECITVSQAKAEE